MSRSPFLKSVSLIAFGCMLGVMSTLGLQLYSPLQLADVTVVFDNVDGIKPGALVKDVAGVDIGTVMAVRSAPQNRAELLIRFNSGEQLPGEESKFRIEGGMQFSLASVSGSFTEARFVRFERGGGKIVDQFVGQSKSQEKEGVKDSLMNLLGRT